MKNNTLRGRGKAIILRRKNGITGEKKREGQKTIALIEKEKGGRGKTSIICICSSLNKNQQVQSDCKNYPYYPKSPLEN